MIARQIEHPKIVSRGEWLAVRKELLAKEKHLTRRGRIYTGGWGEGRKLVHPRKERSPWPGRKQRGGFS